MFFNAQTFDLEVIKQSGDDDKRINLVILSDGYQASEFSKLITDAASFSTEMFTQSPFKEYTNYFNVYIIKVPSNESGTDHPATATDVTEPVFPAATKDTYFNTSFDTSGFHRLLYTYSSSLVYNVLANNFPEYDQPIILVNSSEYGGAGGPYAVSSTGASANEIVIHELGHSLFNLRDEYYPGDGRLFEAINATQETNPTLVKWKNWMGIDAIDIYPYGTSGEAATWNRPHQSCKMRYLGVDFCAVCTEGIVEKIHSLVPPIDSYLPISNAVTATVYPIDFQLNLIKPIPNTLKSTWTLNASNFANDVDDISIIDTDLNIGTNNLDVVVHDDSPFLKVDNHNSVHVYTVSWTITKSALGIDEIISEENDFNISLFPNPSNNILSIKVESENAVNLKVDILSLDGKQVKSTKISNYESNEIHISRLSNGVYLANIYSNNMLLTSKRFVKN
ncbi:M64 family metallo-endopeptidase [Sabulilitoribacter arenilitoris]|uniref:M64 family metallo-endopeptidase n=1 Tax=Wocania arenilitoris TaxID=2044858 RepID=A0AAE3EPY8_9FLAO|nr:M64 family metallopeptidase [Wocania arenilitoris]MCF7569036.1 M64 family metallo-endopeptidase [Wocania arenilitoris]